MYMSSRIVEVDEYDFTSVSALRMRPTSVFRAQCDASQVYECAMHSVLHKWVILRASGGTAAAAASRGFLKLCISVLAANDPIPGFARELLPPLQSETPATVMAKATAGESDSLVHRTASSESVLDTLSIGAREDVDANLWLPGGVQRQSASLVLYLYRAEDIPPGAYH